MRRIFLEFPAFTQLVTSGRMDDSQVAAIQRDILNGAGDTIGKTGGVKKTRAPLGKGKSGGWRAVFADYDKHGVTVLIWAFPKNVQASLTDRQKRTIRELKREIDKEVEARYGKQE